MPDLRELLDGAVDPPTLDAGTLDGMAQRLARRRQHRRIARLATAAAALVLVGATVVALTARSHPGNHVEMPPVGDPDRVTTTNPTDEPGTSTTTAGEDTGSEEGTGDPRNPFDDGTTGTADPGDSESAGPSTTTTTSVADLRTCTPDDLVIGTYSEGATAQQVIGATVDLVEGRTPCSVDTTATFTLRSTTTDEVLPFDGNPLTVALTGSAGPDQPGVGHDTLVLSACPPGSAPDSRPDVVVEIAVAGYGTYRGTEMGARCGDGSGGGSFGAIG